MPTTHSLFSAIQTKVGIGCLTDDFSKRQTGALLNQLSIIRVELSVVCCLLSLQRVDRPALIQVMMTAVLIRGYDSGSHGMGNFGMPGKVNGDR